MKQEVAEGLVALISMLLILAAIYIRVIGPYWGTAIYFVGVAGLLYIDKRWNTPAQQRKYYSAGWLRRMSFPRGRGIDYPNRSK